MFEAPLAEACRIAGISYDTGKRRVEADPSLIVGMQRNARGKPSILVDPYSLTKCKTPPHRIFSARCKAAGVDPAETLHLLMGGCSPDLDLLHACLRIIVIEPVAEGAFPPLLSLLHKRPLPPTIPAQYLQFQVLLAKLVKPRRKKSSQSKKPFSALWAEAKQKAKTWIVPFSGAPVLFAQGQREPATSAKLVMPPRFKHSIDKMRDASKQKIIPPPWVCESVRPARQHFVIKRSADLILIAEALWGKHLSDAEKRHNEAVFVNALHGIEHCELSFEKFPGTRNADFMSYVNQLANILQPRSHRIALKFLSAWWHRLRGWRRTRISRALINRVFCCSRSA